MLALFAINLLPASASADIWGVVGDMFSEFWPIITIIVSVGIAMIAIGYLVSIFTNHK